MWFDAYRALAAIEAGDMPDPAPDPAAGRLARLARLARPPARKPETATGAGTPDDPGADTFAHGQGINGEPRTWTGRVVSLADWRRLSQWERHGPDGRYFYGDTRQWEKPRDPA